MSSQSKVSKKQQNENDLIQNDAKKTLTNDNQNDGSTALGTIQVNPAGLPLLNTIQG